MTNLYLTSVILELLLYNRDKSESVLENEAMK